MVVSREPVCNTCSHDPINMLTEELRAFNRGEVTAENVDTLKHSLRKVSKEIDDGDLKGVDELVLGAEIISTVQDVRRTSFDEMLKMYQLSCRLYETTGTLVTKHLTTNVIIELDKSSREAHAPTKKSFKLQMRCQCNR